ncbi:MAG TPA: nucleotide sugar epimerase, partial [Anaerolineaceae bacterium]|nr:nucleotide sugar epimerase [Anaerolineaceae bacterium]
DDIADGVIKALKPLGYEIVNLGGHETITINELLQRIEHLVGKKANVHYIPGHPADVNANWADVTKARSLLGWEPKVLLAEGIPQLVNWYLEQRAWARDIPLP